MNEPLLEVQNLTHIFSLNRHISLKAVDRVSFRLQKGEILGLVGESGSGKSTIARCIMNLYTPTSGKILYKGINLCDRAAFRANAPMLRSDRQMIFQDSASSLNPRMKIADIIAEPMAIQHRRPPRGSLREEAAYQLKYVGLDSSYLRKYPPELSGGMRQRVAIARALSMEPELLVADEPIASLDVSIQAQIINLLKHCNEEHGCSMLFIAHDLAVVKYLCDRVGVLYQGRLVEMAPTQELFSNPQHPYTQCLMSAIPLPDPRRERARILKTFDPRLFHRDGSFTELLPGHWVLTGGTKA